MKTRPDPTQPVSPRAGRSTGDPEPCVELSRAQFEAAFETIRQIGRGCMGSVFLARQVSLDRPVAIKQIAPVLVREPEMQARFLREARILSQIAHPNVVRLYDFGLVDSVPFLITEYVEGHDLDELVRQGRGGPLERVLAVLRDALEGLEHLHSLGIVHRDLKPANVLIASDGSTKVADFGLARSGDVGSLTQSGVTPGSPAFMAPERLLDRPATPQSDLYSIGVILCEAVTGAYPAGAQCDPAQFVLARSTMDPRPISFACPSLDPGLARLIDDLLERAPEDRPRSARDVGRRIEEILERSEPVGPRRRPGADPGTLPIGRADPVKGGPGVEEGPRARVGRSWGRLWVPGAVLLALAAMALGPMRPGPRPVSLASLASGRPGPPTGAGGDEAVLADLLAVCRRLDIVQIEHLATRVGTLRGAPAQQAMVLEEALRRTGFPEVRAAAVARGRPHLEGRVGAAGDRATRAMMLTRLALLRRLDRLASLLGLPLRTGVDLLLDPTHSASPPPWKPALTVQANLPPDPVLYQTGLHMRRSVDPAKKASITCPVEVPDPARFARARLVVEVESLAPVATLRATIGPAGPTLELWSAVDAVEPARLLSHSFDPGFLEKGPGSVSFELGLQDPWAKGDGVLTLVLESDDEAARRGLICRLRACRIELD